MCPGKRDGSPYWVLVSEERSGSWVNKTNSVPSTEPRPGFWEGHVVSTSRDTTVGRAVRTRRKMASLHPDLCPASSRGQATAGDRQQMSVALHFSTVCQSLRKVLRWVREVLPAAV